MATYRVSVESPTYVYGYIDIEEGEDWDGRPVGDEFDARDLAYDLLVDGSDRVEWTESEVGDARLLDGVEVR